MARTVAHIVGARPNFMKAAPVVEAMDQAGISQVLIHTGQHYDAALSEIFFVDLGLPEPDHYLGVGSGSHAAQTAALMTAIEGVLVDQHPDLVVVYGDINSTVAASLVASKLGIQTAHVEAGLRSFDRTMPEEINRVVTDALADYHFVTSPEALGHLAREGVAADHMYFVGNPMIDTLERVRPTLDAGAVRNRLGIAAVEFGLVTLHRPANVDDPAVLARILTGLAEVAEWLPLVFPVHPRGLANLDRAGLASIGGLQAIEPLGYVEFTSLMAEASAVITDSGGVQEETTVLGVPCFTIRPNTERPITVTHGTNELLAPEEFAADVRARAGLDRSEVAVPPLWDGKAGERIASIVSGLLAD